MRFDHIFILTYGRSGSTLLQGVLNSIPGVIIRGENNAALRPLINSWLAISRAKERLAQGTHDKSNPWFGLADIDLEDYAQSLAATFRRSILRPFPDVVACGFKEIRYYPAMCPNLDDEIAFMRRFFSRSAFVVNTRDLNDTIASVQKAQHEVKREQIEASDARLRSLAARGDPDVFHVHYDAYKGAPEQIQPLFDFLGASFDAASIAAVMAKTHSTRTAINRRA